MKLVPPPFSEFCEHSLQYTFNNPSLLSQVCKNFNFYDTGTGDIWNTNHGQALTHPSINNSVISNYQRLEFLGDAILKFYVGVHLFFSYPDFDQSLLTAYR